MAALVVAVGNMLRGDDGVAHRVADLLDLHPGVGVRRVHQLTPELAEEIARSPTVVFVDADMETRATWLEHLTVKRQPAPITHIMTANQLILLAERLYGFRGEAYMCHVPAEDFAAGGGLTHVAEAGARAAARKILDLL
jgi:hydrogenase maturation protease